jgi:transmembrane sensor
VAEHLNPRGEDPVAPLPDPLCRVLKDPVDERRIARMWRRIEARRAPRPTAWGPSVLGWAAAGAAIALLALFIVGRASEHRRAGPAATVAVASGPLLLRDGRPMELATVPPGGGTRTLELSDGSDVVLGEGTELDPLVAAEREVVLLLPRGSATFHVKPGGPRRWVIEAGLASVEVVGTRFTVTHAATTVKVEVEHGIVLVRGPTVPNGVARLEAAQSLVVHAAATDATTSPAPALPSPLPGAKATSPRSSWRERAAQGQYADAYVELGAAGVARETEAASSADVLFALADVARLSGHPTDAIAPLDRLVSGYPGSPRAPLAAVTLGRIELGLGRARDASRALERALALGVPAGLQEDVYARLVEAHVKAGERGAASAARDEYVRRFPDGRRRADVERWLAP